MNLADCPKCGTTIDLHWIPADHRTPEGEWCDIDAREFGAFFEANETCCRCGERESDEPGGALEYIGDGYTAHVACLRPESVPAYHCTGCDDVVTIGGSREDATEFEGIENLPRQDPPVEVGWHDEVGQVERCEICLKPWDGSWWPGIPPHPGA